MLRAIHKGDYIQGFGGETSGKETAWKTQA